MRHTVKLVIAVVNRQDYRRLHDALVEDDFGFTEIGSTGGFLGEGNTTLLIGVPDERVEQALEAIRQHCRSRTQAVNVAPPDTRMFADPIGEATTVTVGGAQVFVLDVERVVHV